VYDYRQSKHSNYIKQLERFEKGKLNNWSFPNSVDCKVCNNSNEVAQYLSKYMSKNKNLNSSIMKKIGEIKKDKNLKEITFKELKELYNTEFRLISVQGKLWDCSENLENLKYIDRDINRDIFGNLQKFVSIYPDKIIESPYYNYYNITPYLAKKHNLYYVTNLFESLKTSVTLQ
jgi:NAD+--asparagine ADP-ribosyltransferase